MMHHIDSGNKRIPSRNYRSTRYVASTHKPYNESNLNLPSQAGIRFINKLPDQLRNAPTPKVLKTRLRRFLVSQAFYSADEFMAFDWVTAQLAN
ncbi:hypothetical protein J6590_012654 [Homalodisca vitripennis]|nr:hypothetical protein J6590_012654 [Homalodisca vitripennis]